MSELLLVMLGAVTLASVIASVQFLKFWRLSRDRFFVWFALAFVMFAMSYAIRAATDDVSEHTYYVYVPRLAGFLMILYAIFEKNRRGASS